MVSFFKMNDNFIGVKSRGFDLLGGIAMLVLVFGASACEPELPVEPKMESAPHKVLVLCEGNFMWGNAQLDEIDMDSLRLQSDVYRKINDKPLGDVLQSAIHWNRSVYLVVNNSGKVVKLNAQTLKQSAVNSNLGSPRYLLPVGNRLWLTELYANRISILDTTSLKKVGEIPVNGWTETLVHWGNIVAVASYRKGVYLFNADGTAAQQSMLVGDSTTKFVQVDGKGRLWVASTGSDWMSTLKRFDSQQDAYPSVTLIPKEPITQMLLNKTMDSIYFASGNRVWIVSVDATNIDQATVVAEGFQQLYGLGLSNNGKYLFVADAKDYVSNGLVKVIDAQTKQVVKVLESGVNPSGFLSY